MKRYEVNKKIFFITIIAIVAVVILVINTINGKKQSNSVSKDQTKESIFSLTSKSLFEGEQNNGSNGNTSGGNGTNETGDITVYYQDENGNNLIQPVSHSGAIGSWYEFEATPINGYKNSSINPVNRCGYYDFVNDDVVFVYTSASQNYDVSWQNEGVDDAENTVINLDVDNRRSTTEYGLIIVAKGSDGTIINGASFTVSRGNNVIKNGTTQDDKLYVGKLGFNKNDSYTYGITQSASNGLYKKMNGAANLTVTTQWSETDSKYKITNVSIDNTAASVSVNNNGEIVVEIINQERPDPTTTMNVKIEYKSNGEFVDGVKLGVDSGDGNVEEKIATNGIINLDSVSVKDEKDFVYKITEIDVPEEYEPVLGEGVEGIATITSTLNSDETGFVFTGNTNGVDGFSVLVNGRNVVIRINGKPKKYDLSVKKFVYQIEDKLIEGREPKAVMGKNGKYEYIMNDKIEEAANGEDVTFVIRTYNESKNNGEGKKIIEYIPKGLKYLPENELNIQNKWKMYKKDTDGAFIEVQDPSDAELVITDAVEGKILSGFDSNISEGEQALFDFADVRVVFEVDESVFSGKDNRIIENTAQIEKNENDDNGDNDLTVERLYVKYFDLKTTKFIKSVRVKNEKKDEIKEHGESTNGTVIKVDVPKSQVNKTTLTVTYTVKVENVGQIEGYATKVVDYLPNGFEVINKNIWKVNGNVATTSVLDSTLLMPGESTTIDVVCEWHLSETEIGSRINEASVTEYDNPYDAKDITDDNNDKEELIATIKTGSAVYVVIITMIASFSIVAVIYVRNRRKEGIV